MTEIAPLQFDHDIDCNVLPEFIFTCIANPSIKVVGSDEFRAAVSSVIAPLGYRQSSHREPPASGSILLIDGTRDDALDMCRRLGERMPKIVVSSDTSIAFRMKCVGAHVNTIIRFPIEEKEIVPWLEHLALQIAPAPASILLVDDDRLTSQIYAELLTASGMDAEVLNDPLEIVEVISRTFFDLIIMDLQMPKADGIELAKVIRQHHDYLAIPIVFLSAEEDRTIQMKARQLGADDFISKRGDLDALVSLISLRVERSRVMRSLIERDRLTGLLSQRRFKMRVGQELSRSTRTKLQFCLVMVDIDHLADVNETWGRPVGDHVLSVLADALVGWIRKSDVVSRLSGDRFGLLLFDTTPWAVQSIIENFRQQFAALVFEGHSGEFSLTISIGVAGSGESNEPDELFAAALKALQEAKTNGRNQVVLAKLAS